jgi:hypothetical protein
VADFKRVLLFGLLVGAQVALGESAFIHPGLLHDREDLERMKHAVAAKQEPAYSGFEKLRVSPESQLNYVMRGPMAMIGRNPSVGQATYDSDANAAYQCAIMWCITGEEAYAGKSMRIINAWSTTLKSITGRDAVLMAGLGPFKMVNAAEILRCTNTHWSQEEIRKTEKHFREVIYPVLKDFAPFANGNWDTAAMKTMMAIAVFCDDRAMFERALCYYTDGAGDGSLTHYIINDTGQCQESGRDQQHTQLGLGNLADCCEIAWHQGLDLYGDADNLLLKGFEYTARYNLGEDVPFTETLDRTGKYRHSRISTNARGRLRPIFEQVCNHYVRRAGIPAPYTQRAAEQIRPEGGGSFGADHMGFGTLLFTRAASDKTPQTQRAPLSPGGLVAMGLSNQIKLTWVSSIGATRYSVKRSTDLDRFRVIEKNVSCAAYTDKSVRPGEIFQYVVSASNPSGSSDDSYPISIYAGLPTPWSDADIGKCVTPGKASFDGSQFTIETAGSDIGSTNGGFHYTFRPLEGDGAIIVRFVPQTSSQFSRFGLMMSSSLAANASQVSLLLGSETSDDIEEPSWKIRVVSRDPTGADSLVRRPDQTLSAPTVTFGRLTGFCWLKLERSRDTFAAWSSLDGKAWTQTGSATVLLPRSIFVGLVVCSGTECIRTRVIFDNLSLSSPKTGQI